MSYCLDKLFGFEQDDGYKNASERIVVKIKMIVAEADSDRRLQEMNGKC